MLWLAGLMALLAACAFSFLGYLLFRRPRATEEVESALDATEAERLARPDDDEAAARATVPSADPSGAPASGSDAERAYDPITLTDERSGEDEEFDALVLGLSARDEPEGPEEAEDWQQVAPRRPEESDGQEDWFAVASGTSEFDDFDPQQDDLVVVWDDATGPEPRIEVRRSDEDPALTHVLMGDVIVAQVRTREELVPSHVSLIPFSKARSLGWAHA